MRLSIVPVTPFQQNASIVVCEASGKAAVVDPGGEPERLLEAVAKEGASLEKILVTHAHIDHAGAVAELSRRLQLPVEGPHRDDQFWIDLLPEQAELFSLPSAEPFVPDRWLRDKDTVTVGELEFLVCHCPGHTPGHVIFFQPDNRLALVGDVLFQGSIGRTDFPRGDHATLLRSIREKLWPLGDETRFVPGHGPTSTFGDERRGNPFVADHVLAAAAPS